VTPDPVPTWLVSLCTIHFLTVPVRRNMLPDWEQNMLPPTAMTPTIDLPMTDPEQLPAQRFRVFRFVRVIHGSLGLTPVLPSPALLVLLFRVANIFVRFSRILSNQLPAQRFRVRVFNSLIRLSISSITDRKLDLWIYSMDP